MAPIGELNSLIDNDVCLNMSKLIRMFSLSFNQDNYWNSKRKKEVKFNLNTTTAASRLYCPQHTISHLPLSQYRAHNTSPCPQGPRTANTHCITGIILLFISFSILTFRDDLIAEANIPFRIVTISMLSRFIDPEENCPMCADCWLDFRSDS